MSEERAVAVIDGDFKVVAPLVSPEKAVASWEAYQALTRAILKASDFQTFREGGREGRFIKKSGHRKLATHYGFSVKMVDERLGHDHQEKICARIRFPEQFKGERDCGCPISFARYVVEVTAPNGRVTPGIGICAVGEKNRRFTRQDHDIATTAYTRAVNRAISDMIGAGEISAEEVHAVGEFEGLSVEDKTAIKEAWTAAPTERRGAATGYMRGEGFEGDTIAALFTAFNLRATEAQVREVLACLSGVPADFDPDALPE